MATNSKKLLEEKAVLATPNTKQGKKLNEILEKSVRDIYVRDEISWVMPEQNDYVSVEIFDKKVSVQKRLLLNNLRELYKIYHEQNPSAKFRFSHVSYCSDYPSHLCCYFLQRFGRCILRPSSGIIW